MNINSNSVNRCYNSSLCETVLSHVHSPGQYDLILSLFTTLAAQTAMTSFILWVASAPHVTDMHNDV